MTKFLKTIRFDPSDTHVFEKTAPQDEWALPASFLYANLPPDSIAGKQKQAFSNGFWSIESRGHSTFTSVAEIEDDTVAKLQEHLAAFFVSEFNAPSKEAAFEVAKDEIEFVIDMCSDVPINSIFALRRFLDEDGQIREEFSKVQAPSEKTHTKIWEVVEEE